MSMPLEPFPTSSTVRGSAAQGADGNLQEGCESPELIKSLPLLPRGKGLMAHKKALFTRLLRRYLGSGQYASVCALVNIKWFDFNKGGCFL